MKNTQKMYRQGTGLKFVINGLVPYGQVAARGPRRAPYLGPTCRRDVRESVENVRCRRVVV